MKALGTYTRVLLTYLWLFALLYQCLGSLGVWAWAKTHAQELQEACLNKRQPELHCEGKCVLMQKLKAFKQDAEDQEEVLRSVEIPYFIVPIPLECAEPWSFQQKCAWPQPVLTLAQGYQLPPLRPPCQRHSSIRIS
jgi:hypothetical protein